VAERLPDVLWRELPDGLGMGRYSVLWMLVVLTATEVLVGLVVWKAPGHAGPDPATSELDARVLSPAVLPGLLPATALTPAGGPGIGPENPIIAVNVGLGRIFPAASVGAAPCLTAHALGLTAHALGLTAHALVPAVHPALGVLGLLLAITRRGWVSLFVAAVLVSSPAIPRPAVHRLAAGLAAGDGAAADAAAGGRGGDPVNR
jgi:hypothetical protein